MVWKTISIDEPTYNEIKRIAEETHRTLNGTIGWLIDMVISEKKYIVTSISELPHPPDSEAVPIVYAEEVVDTLKG
jgi:hypothetical protein